MKRLCILILSVFILILNSNMIFAKAKKPKISVIIPVYNTEKYLPLCLDSLINQTLRELEIICVNDGSKDNSLKILNKYKTKDNRIKVINIKNQGVSEARNVGLGAAKGEYITFVDSDDYLDLSAYEMLYEYAKKDNVDIIQMGIRKFKDNQDNYEMNLGFSDSPVISARRLLRMSLSNYVWDKLYKHNVVNGKRKLRFVKNINLAEDTCFSYMALSRAKRFKKVDAKFYNYRNRNNSLSKISDEDKFLEGSKMFRYIVEDWESCGYIKNNKDFLLNILIRWIFQYKNICIKYSDRIIKDLSPYINDKKTISKLPRMRQRQINILKKALNNEDQK